MSSTKKPTTLDYINTAYSNVLERQLTTVPSAVRQSAAQAGIRNIAGFQVTDSAIVEKAINTHLKTMKDYALNRAKLIDDLGKADIPVLATLPVAVWNKICTASGLLQFAPTQHGRVHVGNIADLAKQMYATAENITGTTVMVAMFAIIGAMLSHFLPPATHILDWILFSCLVAMGGTIASIFTYGIGFYSKIENAIFKLLVKRHGEIGLMKLVRFHSNGYQNTQLILPNPPEQVREVLFKAFEKYTLKVAAVAEAVSFNPSLSDLVIASNDSRRSEEARQAEQRRLDRLLDPIIYTEQDGVVAVIAQFGDFPVEQALIDRLIAEEVTEEAY